MKIVCLGDSLTGPAPSKPYLHQYLKWTDLVQFGLESQLGAGSVNVINQGKAGDTSTGALRELPARLLSHQPDIAIVLLGANDYSPQNRTEQTAAQFRENLTQIVRQAETAQIRVLLLEYFPPRATNMEKVWTHGDQVNPVIAEVAAAESVPLLNLSPAFERAAQTQPLEELTNPVDGIHLNPGGEIVLATAVVQKLNELGWLKPR